ncbi:ATP-binding protein [Murimonas intestini]|uniref:ATP-binding protein n=1 Tax=Murimonas intestini TaxID=1337051 RepID=UPI0011DE3048|nr:ATP-binding protein [Murimonas intestini]
MGLKAENVFKPGAYPKYTYVSRNYEDTGISYELRLKQALRTAGCLTSLIGPSKMGKTILCEKVIGFENIVEVSGADFNGEMDFWAVVAAKVGLPYAGEITTEREAAEEYSTERDSRNEKFVLSKDKVIQYYKENDKVLVIDDFHYASQEMQMKMAQQLKDAIRRELKVVVVSLPHRSDDAIRQNADLSGRLSLINIEAWKEEDLKEIALKGFKQLNMTITETVAEKLAVECLTSPQLMQYICLSICILLEDKNEETVCAEILETAYKFTTVNFNYYDVVNVMAKGPNTRGKRRNLYRTKSGKELDLYGLIVESFAKNPPEMELDFENIYNRITQLIEEEVKVPDKQSVKNHLNNLQLILKEKEEIYRAIEWKDGKVYILDPLFLFYLRWGRTHE